VISLLWASELWLSGPLQQKHDAILDHKSATCSVHHRAKRNSARSSRAPQCATIYCYIYPLQCQ
jgi:hypothetical protein